MSESVTDEWSLLTRLSRTSIAFEPSRPARSTRCPLTTITTRRALAVDTKENGGRDHTPDRRERSSDIPPWLPARDTTRPSPDCVASIAECLHRRHVAALRCPPIRGTDGLAGRDPWAPERPTGPCTFGLRPAELEAEAEAKSDEGWSPEEVQTRLAVSLR